MTRNFSLILLFSVTCIVVFSQSKTLTLSVIPSRPAQNVVTSYELYDPGTGNTSLAFDDADIFKWSKSALYKAESWGYFLPDGTEVPYIKRDRDLGQTFRHQQSEPKTLQAITVSTNYGTNAIRQNMYGKAVSIQVFEVQGTPKLNTNGSEGSAKAYHGYPHDRYTQPIGAERDDFWEGETYQSIGIFRGAKFPDKTAFGFAESDSISPNHPKIKGKLLRFELPTNSHIVLRPNVQYAFLLMIDEQCAHCGFALANNYYGKYEAGHGIRRDGSGRFPPVPADPNKNFTDPANRKAWKDAHFPKNFKKRAQIPPGTNGYPDVDTWRDLTFWIEAR